MKKFKFETQAEFRAEASLQNPNLGWLEFVLTDAKPNANKQGIPSTAFKHLVETGVHMPIKVAEDGIKMDHSNALPLGPITELQGNDEQVKGRAAIWKQERPNMYAMLKEMREQGEAINISWELAYTQSEEDEDGVTWLLDPRLLAATVVGNPAYEGRTPVLSVASKGLDAISNKLKTGEELTKEESEELSSFIQLVENANQEGEESSNNGDKEMEELEKLQKEFSELQDKFDALASDNEQLQTERDELKKFKEEREEADKKAELLASRLKAMEEAGIEVSEEEIEEKSETWLSMTDEGFASMVELVSKVQSSQASKNNPEIPDLSGEDSEETIELIRQGLREYGKELK